MLVKAGGKNLLMLVTKNVHSCLEIEAHQVHADTGKARLDVCRQLCMCIALRNHPSDLVFLVISGKITRDCW